MFHVKHSVGHRGRPGGAFRRGLCAAFNQGSSWFSPVTVELSSEGAK